MWIVLLDVVLFLTCLFLILLVLVQRGKGGGLAGALGGSGGYSAFGTRAGDMFTKITIGVAAFWLVLAILSVLAHQNAPTVFAGRKAQPPAAEAETRPLGDLPDSDAPGLLPDFNLESELPDRPAESLLPETDEKPSGAAAQSESNSEATPNPDLDP